jgi:hypothetical protein
MALEKNSVIFRRLVTSAVRQRHEETQVVCLLLNALKADFILPIHNQNGIWWLTTSSTMTVNKINFL